MAGAEIFVLALGLLVIVGGFGLAYRWTLSPKAGERMAQADRNYRPPEEALEYLQDIPWRWLLWGYFAVFVVRVALQVVFDVAGASLLTLPYLAGVGIFLWRKRHHRRGARSADDS